MWYIQCLAKIVFTCVICFLHGIISDSFTAWRNIQKTLYVLLCFFTGRSHLTYPHPFVKLRKGKAELALRKHRGNPNSSVFHMSSSSGTTLESQEPSLDDALAQDSSGKEETSLFVEQRDVAPKWSGGGDSFTFKNNKWWVRRRVLRGNEGELSDSTPKIYTLPLVPPEYHLCYSESLHRLVSNIIGPIQQPTVSMLPTRHTAPQWPPHSSSRPGARHAKQKDDFGITTDDYSSTTSSQRHPLRDVVLQLPTSSDAVSGRTNNNICSGSSFRGGAPSVVYRRENSRQVQFDRTVGSRMPSQPIASITSHHVLSYQATRQKVLIMDLDETLCFVSTKFNACRYPPTFSEVIPTTSGAELFHVWERPHVHLFIETMARLYNLALFTSSTKPYADSILRRLDPKHLIKRRYYRHHCRHLSRPVYSAPCERSGAVKNAGCLTDTSSQNVMNTTDEMQRSRTPAPNNTATATGNMGECAPRPRTYEYTKTIDTGGGTSGAVLVKDLRILKVPPELMIMVDNVEECVLANRENALIIPPFFPPSVVKEGENVVTDDVLLSLIPLLEAMLVVPDVRSVLRYGRFLRPE